jgi:hypothetical protein
MVADAASYDTARLHSLVLGTGRELALGEGRGPALGTGRGLELGTGRGLALGTRRRFALDTGRGPALGTGRGLALGTGRRLASSTARLSTAIGGLRAGGAQAVRSTRGAQHTAAELSAMGPALDVMSLQDQVKFYIRVGQIYIRVGLVPVVIPTLIQTSVDVADRLWARVRPVKNKLPIAKELGRPWRAPLTVVLVVAAL